ncbi:MAG: response regulator [Prochloraceae cyanobacterium]
MINEENYADFLCEAQELLQNIEEDLFALKEDASPARIHSLMRYAHTLKGAAASVGLEIIQKIAHVLEDVFKNLYKPEIVIDDEIEALLIEGYECLRLPLMAHFNGTAVDESSMLDRAANTIAKLQEKLGDCFDRDAPIPTSEELGFDVVRSIFEKGIEEKIQEIENANPENLESVLRQKAEVFLGIAESFGLPGFGEIAATTITALDNNGDRVKEIATQAIEDFRVAQKIVLDGDRSSGGFPSPTLQALALVETESVSLSQAFDAVDLESSATASVSLSQAFDAVDLEDDRTAENQEIQLQESNDSSISLQTIFANIPVDDPENNVDETSREKSQVSETVSIEPREIQSANLNTNPVKQVEQTTVKKSPETKPAPIKIKSQPKNSKIKRPDRLSGSVRVEIERLERLNHITGELLINQNQQGNQDERLRSIVQELLDQFKEHKHDLNELLNWSDSKWIETEKWTIPKRNNDLLNANFDALEMDSYSDLQLLVKKTIDRAIQLEAIVETIAGVAKQSRLSRETQKRQLNHLRDDLTNARMQPLKVLLNRFPPLLKQLNRSNNKKAELLLLGTEVLVDKAIVEKLYDPLLHLVRNAFDHGIESPEKRRERNKTETGKIEIKAYHQGNRTTIEIKDDGNGINTEKIARRAIEMDLVTPEQLQGMTKDKIHEFLFEPGFSTADKITDLSGRGVGLDVVRSQLQAVEGSVTIDSIPSKGTTFSLQIPLSLTITELLICKAKGICYALPVDTVEQIIIPQSNRLGILGKKIDNYDRQNEHQGISRQVVLRWQEEEEEILVPVHKLSQLIEYSSLSSHFLNGNDRSGALMATEGLLTQQDPVVLLRTSNGLSGLQVEQILGEKELVLRPLGDTISPAPYIYGCCILSSSRLALAIDIEQLIEHSTKKIRHTNSNFTNSLSSALLPSNSGGWLGGMHQLPPANKARKSIVLLVVDDSLTLRRSLSRTLEKVGYQVYQAGDGQEALELLDRENTVNLIVCDVEMPRVNGFEFLNKMRQYPNLTNIPVVMLTSRGGNKYRQIASELGASAYLTKPYSETELISTLNEILK